jgi:hypothetical protein
LILTLAGTDAQRQTLFVGSKQDTHRWLAPLPLNFDPIPFSLSVYFSPAHRAVIEITESLPDLFLTNFHLYYGDWFEQYELKGDGPGGRLVHPFANWTISIPYRLSQAPANQKQNRERFPVST